MAVQGTLQCLSAPRIEAVLGYIIEQAPKMNYVRKRACKILECPRTPFNCLEHLLLNELTSSVA